MQLRAGQLWKRASETSPGLLEDKPPAVTLDSASIWSRWPAKERARSFPAKHFCSMSKNKKTRDASLSYFVPRLWNKKIKHIVLFCFHQMCLFSLFCCFKHTHLSLNIWTVGLHIYSVCESMPSILSFNCTTSEQLHAMSTGPHMT